MKYSWPLNHTGLNCMSALIRDFSQQTFYSTTQSAESLDVEDWLWSCRQSEGLLHRGSAPLTLRLFKDQLAVLICYTMDEPWKHNAMRMKPTTKEHLVWFCLCDVPRVGKPIETECRVEIAYNWSWEYTCAKILRSRFWVMGYTHFNFTSYQIVFQNGAVYTLISRVWMSSLLHHLICIWQYLTSKVLPI